MGMRIVSDSSSDLFELDGVDYVTVPLKVMFASREYVDDKEADPERMMVDLQAHDGPSTTSCPNAQEWLDAFEGADQIFAITISSGLSASYDAAMMAKSLFEKEHPEAHVHVFDSKATGPVLRLIIEYLREGIVAGKSYDAIKAETEKRQESVRILYSLKSLNNLARNGRVNQHIARIAGALNIYAIGHASELGTVELLHKSRGEKRSLKILVKEMEERGFYGGRVVIDHCVNTAAAEKLKDLILDKFPTSDVSIARCGVLCSYYADLGGIIVGYEA